MIKVVDLVQHYGVRPVLCQVNFTVNGGELVVLLGPNGMGKTTLMAAIAGVLTPQAGYVEIDGLRRKQSVETELVIRKKIFYLPDHPWLPVTRTGREFLLAVGRLWGVGLDRLMDHTERLLELFELSDQGDSPIRAYSNGQQKKLAICSALVTDAPILLLDEPFSGGLDPAGLLALKRVLQHRVAELRHTVVLTSPVPEIVEEIAHRVIILPHGDVAAFAALDGLRRLTGQPGSLGTILERLLYPETVSKLRAYFGEDRP